MSDTTLLVANDGGHFMQMLTLSKRLDLDDVVWATVPTPQTETLLEGSCVEWTHPAPTRDLRAVARNTQFMRSVVARHRPSKIVSTGASLALSSLPIAAIHDTPAHYIESVTRADSFSLSGRVLRHAPRVKMYTQWPHMADEHWQYRGSVLDGFSASQTCDTTVNSIVVSLGTSQTYGFRRLLERLVEVIPPDVSVLWQTGSTDTSELGIDAMPTVPGDKLEKAIEDADVVIAHAGAGISLTAITAGRHPLIVPRRAEHGEHVDGHQGQIANRLGEMGLAMVREVDDIAWSDIERAACFESRRDELIPTFDLS
ncbi:glycosyltransferase [Ilumatobacter sp.]|uniref:glycosyltransferase n=1 Tax=Ilumatobacter sp. TaxID=1967498 RepID=UPI003B522856